MIMRSPWELLELWCAMVWSGTHGKCPGEIISEYVRMARGRPEHCTFKIVVFSDLESPATPGEVFNSVHEPIPS